ncbi:hypothetical protein [Frigidibacter sp. MR17.24]|uniref:hypothetical protein n=1 Tax=Frigidibacter sp. MR17.24 TaxID=3127345 RepID=UPI00301304CF
MIPDLSDPRWKRVLTSEAELGSASLATRILVNRLRREVKAVPGSIGSKSAELRDFVTRNSFALADISAF